MRSFSATALDSNFKTTMPAPSPRTNPFAPASNALQRPSGESIEAAQKAGLKIKINVVALRGVNEHELKDLVAWAHGKGMDITLIETMPMGDVDADRTEQYLPLSLVRAELAKVYTLEPTDERTGGPARYVRVKETGGRLGFITPLSHNFCESCNRVRLTCTGTL